MACNNYAIQDIEKLLHAYNDLLTNIEVMINLKNDVVLVPILINTKKFKRYEKVVPFYRNVANEGVTLYEQ